MILQGVQQKIQPLEAGYANGLKGGGGMLHFPLFALAWL